MSEEVNIIDILRRVETNDGSAFFYTPQNYRDGKSVYFEKPVKTVIINNKSELDSGLDLIREYLNAGLIGYSLIAYEFGYILEEKLEKLLTENYDFDLLKIHFFDEDNVQFIETKNLDFSGISEKLKSPDYKISNFRLNTEKEKYISDINKVKDYIAEGDTYQVNYTVKGKFDFSGNYSDLFLNLVFNQSAEFCTLINNGTEFLVSVSPELFFENEGLKIQTRPMKGTVKRGSNEKLDLENSAWLRESKKDQAENVMIVDLLRNDLGRISKFNSVYVKSLFDIEKYESLFQMTSTVCSELCENDLGIILKEIFPCGSITGAPKMRTMEIIKELENEPRGIYTGSIGIVSKENNVFNVAIRTARINKSTGKGEIGIGSGVVWDSIPESEYEETLLKGSFLTNPQKYFELFETILFENGKYHLFEFHKERMKNSAQYFLFNFDSDSFDRKLELLKENFKEDKKYKIKISLNKFGKLKTESEEIVENNFSGKIFLSDKILNPENRFLYHKTTRRELYTEELQKVKLSDYDEVIFQNDSDFITEGSFTNIFVEKNGKLYTPELSSGILPGCFRKLLIENKKCEEKNISLKDLQNADKVFIGNSVRGLITIKEIWNQSGLIANF